MSDRPARIFPAPGITARRGRSTGQTGGIHGDRKAGGPGMGDTILHDHGGDGIDRRGFLSAWPGRAPGVALDAAGRRPPLLRLRAEAHGAELAGELHLRQISDSHIGFAKEANPDVTATLQEAVDRINALPRRPAFVLHTGDITPALEAERVRHARTRCSRGVRTDRVFYVPGEHDVARGQRHARTSTATARDPRRAAGTASTTAACTSSAWSTCSTSRPAGSATSARSSSTG